MTFNTSKRSRKQNKKKPVKRRRPHVAQQPNALVFTIRGFQQLGGPGKTSIYQLGKAGVLELIKDGLGRTLITGKSGRAFLGVTEEEVA
jgi:hypothetical protein